MPIREGIAVRRRFGHRVGADVATSASRFSTTTACPKALLQVRHGARHDVGGATGQEGHNDFDRFVGVLRECRSAETQRAKAAAKRRAFAKVISVPPR